MNTGKIFEKNFKASVPEGFFVLRLHDPAVAFSGGGSFAPHNLCDFLLFDGEALFCAELKSKNGAMTFWKPELENDGKKHTFDIKKHQILGLREATKYKNVFPVFILNFRNVGRTFCVSSQRFDAFVNKTDKGSLNHNDAENIGIEVAVRKLRVNERYDIAGMCGDVLRNQEVTADG